MAGVVRRNLNKTKNSTATSSNTSTSKGKTGVRQNISDRTGKYYDLQRNGDIVLRSSSTGKVLNTYKAGTSANQNILKKRFTDVYRKKYSGGRNSSNGGTNSTGDTSSSIESTKSPSKLKWVQKTVEEAITSRSEAEDFGLLEVNKARRGNGHSLECKVIGSNKFKEGEWALVQIPSFDINEYMYITKVDHSLSPSDEWITALTLVDYPPSFGSGSSNTLESESEENVSGDEINTSDTSNTTSSNTSNSSHNSSSTSRRTSSTGSNSTRVNSSFSSKSLSSSSSSRTTSTSTGSVVKSSNDDWGKKFIGWIASSIRKRINGK